MQGTSLQCVWSMSQENFGPGFVANELRAPAKSVNAAAFLKRTTSTEIKNRKGEREHTKRREKILGHKTAFNWGFKMIAQLILLSVGSSARFYSLYRICYSLGNVERY